MDMDMVVREITPFIHQSYINATGTECIKNSDWLLLDDSLNSNVIVLVSKVRPVLTSFEYEQHSGTDHIRKRNMALMWAEENPESECSILSLC